MIRVLITGGAGYKGVILAEQLLKTGCKVTILDNFLYGYELVLGFAADKNCTIVKGIEELVKLYAWYQPYQNYRPI